MDYAPQCSGGSDYFAGNVVQGRESSNRLSESISEGIQFLQPCCQTVVSLQSRPASIELYY